MSAIEFLLRKMRPDKSFSIFVNLPRFKSFICAYFETNKRNTFYLWWLGSPELKYSGAIYLTRTELQILSWLRQRTDSRPWIKLFRNYMWLVCGRLLVCGPYEVTVILFFSRMFPSFVLNIFKVIDSLMTCLQVRYE